MCSLTGSVGNRSIVKISSKLNVKVFLEEIEYTVKIGVSVCFWPKS